MYDLIIIGGGPGGLTAGIYSARAGLKTLILEKAMPGGQVLNTHLIENYPGFPDGVGGWDLMECFTTQAKNCGAEIEIAEVTSLAIDGQERIVNCGSKQYKAKAVLIATGAIPRKLGAKGEERFIGFGVSYCGTCDGPLYRDKDVVVIGGGNTALQEIDFLSRFVKKIYLIHRREEFRGQRALVNKLNANDKVTTYLNSEVTEIFGEQNITGVKIQQNGEEKIITAQGVFIFVGHDPVTGFCRDFLATDDKGFIKVNSCLETSRQGFFAAGDVLSKDFFQIATAVGEGAEAVHSIEKYLK